MQVVELEFDSGSVDGLLVLTRVQGRTYCSACSSGSREALGVALGCPVALRSSALSEPHSPRLPGWLPGAEEVCLQESAL